MPRSPRIAELSLEVKSWFVSAKKMTLPYFC